MNSNIVTSFHNNFHFLGILSSSSVEPDFELRLEVYAVMMDNDLTIASTPRKIKNTIHSSISRTGWNYDHRTMNNFSN